MKLSNPELALSRAFHDFRTQVKQLIASGDVTRRRAGHFAVEILGKRLLSCPTAFAESWQRSKAGLAAADRASDSELLVSRGQLAQAQGDDLETRQREAEAAGVVGAWLGAIASQLQAEINALDTALAALGFGAGEITDQNPHHDARYDALCQLVQKLLQGAHNRWRDDERLIVFTEYKTTLDYLLRRLRGELPAGKDSSRVLALFGGMSDAARIDVRQEFNDPQAPVRILVATDAAAEGLNLQHTARYLLHYDCPWNPSRLEQRNGRLDRHGQSRDVTIHHFISELDDDLRFLDHVVRKANEIREDLGSANELFDAATHRRLVEGEALDTVRQDLQQGLEVREAVDITTDNTVRPVDEVDTAIALDLNPEAMRQSLDSAMSLDTRPPQLECTDQQGVYSIRDPRLRGWAEVIDDSLRLEGGRAHGALPQLAFSTAPLMRSIGGRQIFTPRPEVALMHLSHGMLHRASDVFARRRFPGSDQSFSRWTMRCGKVPTDADALLLLSMEEWAFNELREPFHHWINTAAFAIRNGELDDTALPYQSATQWSAEAAGLDDSSAIEKGRQLLYGCEQNLKEMMAKRADMLSSALRGALQSAGEKAKEQAESIYQSRNGEISQQIADSTVGRLEREIEALRRAAQQGQLFNSQSSLDSLERSITEKEQEISLRKNHYEEIRQQLSAERARIVHRLLPKRHAMHGEAQVSALGIELRLPAP